MKHEEIDRILRGDVELEPSSGFTSSVMDAVRREAAGPEPLAFPWRQVLPGMAICALAVVVVVIAALIGSNGVVPSWEPQIARLEQTLRAQSTMWLTISLLGSWLLVRMSLMFAGFER
jgi:hypothetical protein